MNPSGGPKVGLKACEEEQNVRIEVWDNGGGIPPDVIDRVFNPFVTTKPIGEGTGMGLSISYKIIDSHRGTLSCNNRNDGAVFEILLPKPKPNEGVVNVQL